MENDVLVAEELARVKIRKWLSEEEGKKKNFWKVINAPIFLWLVSSVLLSGLVFCTSLITDHFAGKRDLQNRLTNLRVELSYRMDPVVLEALFTQGEDGINVSFGAIQVWCATPIFNAQRIPTSHSATFPTFPQIPAVGLSEEERQILISRFVFPEFEGRSIFSLLWELETITTNDTERQKVKNATEAINLMRNKAILEATVSRDLSISPIETLRVAWKNGAWAGS